MLIEVVVQKSKPYITSFNDITLVVIKCNKAAPPLCAKGGNERMHSSTKASKRKTKSSEIKMQSIFTLNNYYNFNL